MEERSRYRKREIGKGGKDEEEHSLPAIPYGELGQSIRLNMKASDKKRTKCTSRQAQALVLESVQNAEGARGSNTIDMNTVIQFRTEKYEKKTT